MMITTCLRHALCLAHPKCAGRQQRGAAGMSSREYRSESRMRQPSPTKSSPARKAKSQRTDATETARRDRTAAPMPCTSLRSGLCCFHLARNENSVVNEVYARAWDAARLSGLASRSALSLDRGSKVKRTHTVPQNRMRKWLRVRLRAHPHASARTRSREGSEKAFKNAKHGSQLLRSSS
jgi:hypothetical protein